MAFSLEAFYIDGLHGRGSFNIEIKDNKLVIVGENGSGKTTIINILYYFLSRQWKRLCTYDFQQVKIILNNEECILTKKMLMSEFNSSRKDNIRHKDSMRYNKVGLLKLERIRGAFIEIGRDTHPDSEQMEVIADKFGLPTSLVHELYHRFCTSEPGWESSESPIDDDYLGLLDQKIGRMVKEQILYLPTYRRIEQDLKTIFPSLYEGDFRERLSGFSRGRGFIELVAFGMEDVRQNFETTMEELKENMMADLNKLIATYFIEVIEGKYKSISAENINLNELETIEVFFSRIDEKTLPSTVKNSLRSLVEKIRSNRGPVDEEKVIVLFLLNLLNLHKKQQTSESVIKNFVAICNKYLTSKQFYYNSNAFNMKLYVHDKSNKKSQEVIELMDLSSGEKQIVSLFNHLILSNEKSFFVLIDEPELSLSVDWQTKFLPDVINTKKCSGLIAATHSPFIFQNELDPYTKNLTSFFN